MNHLKDLPKLAIPLKSFVHCSLQKISATDEGELILSIYSASEKRRTIVLSTKKGESGLFIVDTKLTAQSKPNSFVQIARKYVQGEKITAAYVTFSPLSFIFEFHENCLLLDLSGKFSRLVLAQKYSQLPERYQPQFGKVFRPQEDFFESLCEWSDKSTKTKRRACFEEPVVGFCPFIETSSQPVENMLNSTEQHLQNKVTKPLTTSTENTSPLSVLPGHIRKAVRTRMQFLERRLMRQKADLPSEVEISRLQKQSEGLKNVLYLWPQGSLTWHVPEQFIEDYGMPVVYTLNNGEKPAQLLNQIHDEIAVLRRRRDELTKRIAMSEQELKNFDLIVQESLTELNLKENGVSLTELSSLLRLCQILDIPITVKKQVQQAVQKQEKKLPYRSFITSTGEFVRVARSAADGDAMIKLMPSHHVWMHVLTGEGSHVWLEKPKGRAPSLQARREAAILAVHYSKHRRAQQAEVQFATRADIEKKKNLPPGKVLVRRCETNMIKYTEDELQKLFKGEL